MKVLEQGRREVDPLHQALASFVSLAGTRVPDEERDMGDLVVPGLDRLGPPIMLTQQKAVVRADDEQGVIPEREFIHRVKYLAQIMVTHADQRSVLVAQVFDLFWRLAHPPVVGPVEVRTAIAVWVEGFVVRLRVEGFMGIKGLDLQEPVVLVAIGMKKFEFFRAELFNSLQQQAYSYGYTLVTYFSHGFSEEERKRLYQTIFARHPIGIIASPFSFTAEDVALARERGINHIIFIGFHPQPIEHTYTIAFPSRALGYLAAHHLMERGHRHLALVHPDDPVQEEAFLQRLEGMHEAIAEKPGVRLDILPLHLSAASARSLVKTSFMDADRPTGVYGFGDQYAVALLGALTRSGIQVPQEVALVGSANLPLGEFVWPSLTSMSFDAIDIGKRAVEMLHALHQGLPLSEELTHPLVPRLIQREST